MPLPKSVLCSACKKTYPEGWRRCPYCGHDELRHRQESSSRKFMQKKVQEILEYKRKYLESAIRDAHAAGLIQAPDPAAK